MHGKYEYFIIFNNDYSRFGFLYREFDAFDTFIKFKVRSDNLLSKHICHFD